MKKTFNLKGAKNVNEMYFTPVGVNKYRPTSLFIYNVVRDAMEFCKDQIFAQDTECQFHTETLGEFKDVWTDKKNQEKLKLQYGEQYKEFERRKREWREANEDKCDKRAGGPNLGDEDEMHFFGGYSPEFKPTLTEAVALYKYLKEVEKEDTSSLRADIEDKPDVLLVKNEFKAEYKALCDKWAAELGLPLTTEQVGTVTRTKYTINRTNSQSMKAVASSDVGLEEFVNGLVAYITSSDKEEYKVKRREWLDKVNNDFVEEFNDSSKNLKAQDNGVDETSGEQAICIYTKTTDMAAPMKIITIKRDSPYENFKYIFEISTDTDNLRYTKVLSCISDLRKALEMTIAMIEDTAFKKFVPDIQAEIDKLN
ncbi:MAG: hypothetical protein IKX02_01400 [Spirochaetales bacterium]|nr:hypothetical protein [Spirochaetales bacterium]